MKTFAKLAVAAALALATASGTVTATPADAATAIATTSGPWATVAYLRNGQLVGGTELYCDGNDVSWGDTVNYDNQVWAYFYMCP